MHPRVRVGTAAADSVDCGGEQPTSTQDALSHSSCAAVAPSTLGPGLLPRSAIVRRSPDQHKPLGPSCPVGTAAC